MRWILVTASFGGLNFHDAAQRVIKQGENLNLFDSYIHVHEENLSEFAPRTLINYRKLLNSSIPGYGYFAWKPEIIDTVFKLYPDCGVVYIDAGCELNHKLIAKMRLRWFLKIASKGTFLHVLKYSEKSHTKKKVLEHFKLNSIDSSSPQFQATWFMLSGIKGREIAKSWADASLLDLNMIDDSRFAEDSEFVAHRHDQSIFSCVLKSMKIKPNRHRPCFRPLTPLSRINCYLHPIWSARNKSGESIQ